MDKKKSITILRVLFACLFTIFALPISAQDVSKIQFCDKKYEYGEGKDSITLFFKVLDKNGEAVKDVTLANLEKYLVFYEEDKMMPKRVSMDNAQMQDMYTEFFGEPGSELAEKLLHTTYSPKKRFDIE